MWRGHAYRESEPKDTALPMSRVAIRPFSHAIIAGAVIATLIPVFFFGDPNVLLAYRGGRGLLLFDVACPLMIAILGFRLIRGKTAPPSVFVLTSLLPLAISLFTAWLWVRDQGAPRDQGFYFTFMDARVQGVRLFASAITASSLALATLCFAAFFATIDRKRHGESGANRTRAVFFFGLLLTAGATGFQGWALQIRSSYFEVALVLSLFLSWCASQTFATARVACVCEQQAERRRARSVLLWSVFTAAAVLPMFDVAIVSRSRRDALSWASDAGAATGLDYRALVAAMDLDGHAGTILALHAGAGLLLLLPALYRALLHAPVRRDRPLDRAFWGTTAMVVLCTLSVPAFSFAEARAEMKLLIAPPHWRSPEPLKGPAPGSLEDPRNGWGD